VDRANAHVHAIAVARLPQDDVHLSAIRHPARDGCLAPEEPVRVLDAAIVLFPELVHFRERIGVAPSPEGLYEGIALLGGLELLKRFALAVGNNVGDFLLEPCPMPLEKLRAGLCGGEGGRDQDQSNRPHRISSCQGPL